MKTFASPRFPEHLFPIANSRLREYDQHVSLGMQTMQQCRVVICGLVRDVSRVLTRSIERVELTGSLFEDYRVVVMENDSQDGTRYLLKQWANNNPRVTVIGDNRGDPVNPARRCLRRATRMAHYRNEVRVEISKQFQAWATHVIVIDLDVGGGWSLPGLANTFGQHSQWDFVGSNGILFRPYGTEPNKPVYYDVWAFRWRGTDKPTRPEDINPLYWPKGSKLLPVNSCFGGMGVYRMEAMLRGSYSGQDCEHVMFHKSLREAGLGRLFMNPSQIVLYNDED